MGQRWADGYFDTVDVQGVEVLWPNRCHEFRYVFAPFWAVILVQGKQFGVECPVVVWAH